MPTYWGELPVRFITGNCRIQERNRGASVQDGLNAGNLCKVPEFPLAVG